MVIKESVHEENVTLLNVFTSINIDVLHMKLNPIELKRKMEKSIIIHMIM